MKYEQQVLELAKLAGHDVTEVWLDGFWMTTKDGKDIFLPDYDSHDALQPIIDSMPDRQSQDYVFYLATAIGLSINEKRPISWPNHWVASMLKAKPAKIREAILKAYKKWEV